MGVEPSVVVTLVAVLASTAGLYCGGDVWANHGCEGSAANGRRLTAAEPAIMAQPQISIPCRARSGRPSAGETPCRLNRATG
jgi:hypothetical protein